MWVEIGVEDVGVLEDRVMACFYGMQSALVDRDVERGHECFEAMMALGGVRDRLLAYGWETN